MTLSLNNVAVQQFADNFINEYQGKEKLEGTTLVVRNVIGDAYKFKLAGKVNMEDRGSFQSLLNAQDVSYTAPTVAFTNKILNLPTDIFEQAEVNANERQNLAKTAAASVGREVDRFVLDALNASTTSKTVPVSTTNLTVDKLIAAKKSLLTDDVPGSEVAIAVTENQLDSLLRETEVTSSDFNTVKALVNGELNTYMGFRFYIIGTGRGADYTLPVAGNNRTVFVWHQSAVGLAFGINPMVTVDWSPERQSWLTIAKLRAGATEIDPNGIVKIVCDETA